MKAGNPAAMIIREVGFRHARRALSQPVVRRACRRAFTTETVATKTITAELDPVPEAPSSSSSSQPPSIFTANAKLTTRRKKVEEDRTAELFQIKQHVKREIGKVGSKVVHRYRPGDVFLNPPGPKDVTLELLMASQAHMGHHVSLWNPANARYIHGIRQDIHIISLEQTAAHLRRAARVVEEVAYRGGLILFVGSRPGQAQAVTLAAKLARGCHLFTKWVPGAITNSDVILQKSRIRVVDENDEPVTGYDEFSNGRRALVPDLVVCLNPRENYVMLHECALSNIPTIGIIDTNTEPTWVTYAIPANDDSLRCAAVISSVLGRAGEAGHQRRLEDAKLGVVAWQTPLDIRRFVQIKRNELKRKSRAQGEEDASKKDEIMAYFRKQRQNIRKP